MVFNYTSIHTTKGTLFPDMKNLVDEYVKKTATEAEVKDVLAQWKRTSGLLFLDQKNPDKPQLTARTRKLIGNRRGDIVQTLLDSMAE